MLNDWYTTASYNCLFMHQNLSGFETSRPWLIQSHSVLIVHLINQEALNFKISLHSHQKGSLQSHGLKSISYRLCHIAFQCHLIPVFMCGFFVFNCLSIFSLLEVSLHFSVSCVTHTDRTLLYPKLKWTEDGLPCVCVCVFSRWFLRSPRCPGSPLSYLWFSYWQSPLPGMPLMIS